MKLRHLLMVASVAALTACASTTPYQEASKPGGFDGFSQTMIENDRARVSFGGNSLTERDTVENYLIYRAAELAVERGFESFTLTERNVEEKSRLSGGSSFGGVYDPYFNYSFYRPSFGWSGGHRFSSFGGFRGGHGFGRRGFGRSAFGGSSFGFGGRGFNGGFSAREITKYRASAEVKFGRFKRSDADNSFNAREVLENLGPTLVRPEEKV